MRATVTGADGFVGQWLLRQLLADGHEVIGLIRGSQPALTTLDAQTAGAVEWRSFDLLDLEALQTHIKHARPDWVFHLAAQSSVPESLERPIETLDANVLGTLNVLQACRTSAPDAVLIAVGSSDAYGHKSADMMPLRENMALAPGNPYASSKAAAETIALQYAQSGWVRAIATRSFNHSGPGQSTKFAIGSFAKQIADVKAKRRPPHVRVGALEPTRDITDVRDIVGAYVLLAQRGTAGTVYNVCSGVEHSMRQVLDKLIAIAGVSVDVLEDPSLVRAVDTSRLVGDPSRLRNATGWQPRIDFTRMLTDLLEYYGSAA